MKVRILLADDHALFVDALRTVLSMEPDMDVVGIAENGTAVVSAALALQPDVVCMDVNMPGINGVDATKSLLAQMPKVKVIGISGHDDSLVMHHMVAAGAVGYVAKCRAGDEVPLAIRAAMQKPSQKAHCVTL
jgi:DNA-binding NarL/FixJ family response regulator